MPKTRRFRINWGPIVITSTILIVIVLPLAFFAYSLVSTPYMKQGERAFNLEQYDRARDNYFVAMEWGGPKKAYSQYLASARQLGELERAVNDYSKIIKEDSDNYLPYFYRAEVYKSLGKYELAAQDYKACLERGPDHLTGSSARNTLAVFANKGIK